MTVPRMRLNALSDPVTVEELAEQSGIPARDIWRGLAELEAAGWIEAATGGRYWLTVPKDDPRGPS